MKILATAGYFDLDIPYFATTYTMNHIGIDPEMAANIKVRLFPAATCSIPIAKRSKGLRAMQRSFLPKLRGDRGHSAASGRNQETKNDSPIDNSQNPVIRLRGWIDLERRSIIPKTRWPASRGQGRSLENTEKNAEKQ